MKTNVLKMTFPAWTLAPMLASMMMFAAPLAPVQSDKPKTADDHTNNKRDLNLTAKIRKALLGDKTLSISAHNVKIITQNSMVTLRGTVRSDAERDAVLSKAREIAGATMVTDSLTVSQVKTTNGGA